MGTWRGVSPPPWEANGAGLGAEMMLGTTPPLSSPNHLQKAREGEEQLEAPAEKPLGPPATGCRRPALLRMMLPRPNPPQDHPMDMGMGCPGAASPTLGSPAPAPSHHRSLRLQGSPSSPKTPAKPQPQGGPGETRGGPNVLSPKETFPAQVAYMKNLREGQVSATGETLQRNVSEDVSPH